MPETSRCNPSKSVNILEKIVIPGLISPDVGGRGGRLTLGTNSSFQPLTVFIGRWSDLGSWQQKSRRWEEKRKNGCSVTLVGQWVVHPKWPTIAKNSKRFEGECMCPVWLQLNSTTLSSPQSLLRGRGGRAGRKWADVWRAKLTLPC